MRASQVLPLVLLVGGVGVIADAVARGGASVALVVVLPVIFGASAEFFLGVVLLFCGLVTLPLAFGYTLLAEGVDEGPRPAALPAAPPEAGGLLLVGPVPIFFGRWGRVSRRARVLAAAAGTALLLVAVAIFLGLR